MCGVAGFIDRRAATAAAALESTARAMAGTLRLRGPDDSGTWTDEAAGIALGHRRLSIVDLSAAGHQPMVSANGRFVIAYNGEIYNARALGRDLERGGPVLRGHSDTEVLVECIARDGLDSVLPKLIGMFAFALWDRETRTLSLVRDRIGIKPMYWGWCGETFLFGSELKALRAHPEFRATVERDSLLSLLRHNYIRGPHSIYEGIYKLMPGHVLSFASGGEPEIAPYWTLDPADAETFAGRPETELLAELETLLRDAVSGRMIADVPLGSFLSGGVDSSTVTALMQAQSAAPVRTFTIGFSEPGYNEAEHAKAVAKHLGTDHTELYVEPGHARDAIPNLPQWFDEPFADASQIPTYLVSELTRRHVTVALSGDGGDEIFAGYTRYLWSDRIWRRLETLPRAWRLAGAGAIRALPPAAWDRIIGILPRSMRPPQAGERLYKMAAALPARTVDEVYRALISQWQDPSSGVIRGSEPRGLIFDETLPRAIPDPVLRMQYLDTLTYLPDDILTKVDRASMAVSLEARVPLLDHRVAEFAWALPRTFKIRDGVGKWPLRQILYKYVPRDLIERPKQGFAVPIGAWLRGPLRDWGEALLAENRLRAQGFFEASEIRRLWAEHQSGRRNRQYQLWGPLMFQAWHEYTMTP